LWLAVVACGCGLRLWLVAEVWLWPLIMAYGQGVAVIGLPLLGGHQ
jgi:hypothetical protein